MQQKNLDKSGQVLIWPMVAGGGTFLNKLQWVGYKTNWRALFEKGNKTHQRSRKYFCWIPSVETQAVYHLLCRSFVEPATTSVRCQRFGRHVGINLEVCNRNQSNNNCRHNYIYIYIVSYISRNKNIQIRTTQYLV